MSNHIENAPLDHVLVPVASEKDAAATCAALKPYLGEIERVTAVHVIEKGGGAPDKAPLGKRQEDAVEFLGVVESRLGDEVPVDTRTAYGTDVVATLFDEAATVGATAIAFRPRGGSRIVQILTGDTANRLVTDAEIPVVSLPDPDEG
ncbi:Universal stress protein family protein [Halomicrobium zhouii]|uniref:Universal stress protein family protein n=1 Tax=Halomicrobium zhouii TaxID=767519 RepID=A0A1I6KRY4_9EURY|nr:universal stress protein [Halomicrobium zhouii]SFR94003.1 Universal stress protein family protein [Halomicrobium zhouii]